MRLTIRRAIAVALLGVGLVGSSGCHSIVSTGYHGPRAYGGVRCVADNLSKRSNEGPIVFWFMADLPLSFAVDTVMLPVTIPCEARR